MAGLPGHSTEGLKVHPMIKQQRCIWKAVSADGNAQKNKTAVIEFQFLFVLSK